MGNSETEWEKLFRFLEDSAAKHGVKYSLPAEMEDDLTDMVRGLKAEIERLKAELENAELNIKAAMSEVGHQVQKLVRLRKDIDRIGYAEVECGCGLVRKERVCCDHKGVKYCETCMDELCEE